MQPSKGWRAPARNAPRIPDHVESRCSLPGRPLSTAYCLDSTQLGRGMNFKLPAALMRQLYCTAINAALRWTADPRRAVKSPRTPGAAPINPFQDAAIDVVHRLPPRQG